MDEEFGLPRLTAVYDALDPQRDDLDPYRALVHETGARNVVDVGCGTGTLALLLAGDGLDVVGVDPASASLDIARSKPGADAVRWLHGTAETLPGAAVDDRDLATMTANVAMFLHTDDDLAATLAALADAVRPGGHLAFETRRPEAQAWLRWTRSATLHDSGDRGPEHVTAWVETTAVRWPFVDIRNSFHFADGTELTSDSTLRYRERTELEQALRTAGFGAPEFRDAPDRPGSEWIVVARRDGDRCPN